jgi:hypothetical protein
MQEISACSDLKDARFGDFGEDYVIHPSIIRLVEILSRRMAL